MFNSLQAINIPNGRMATPLTENVFALEFNSKACLFFLSQIQSSWSLVGLMNRKCEKSTVITIWLL